MGKHYKYGSEELFDLKPTLTEALVANPIKSLLLLVGTYAIGAIVGRERSVQGVRRGAQLAGQGARFVEGKVRNMRAPAGSPMMFDQTIENTYYTPSLFLNKKKEEESY